MTACLVLAAPASRGLSKALLKIAGSDAAIMPWLRPVLSQRDERLAKSSWELDPSQTPFCPPGGLDAPLLAIEMTFGLSASAFTGTLAGLSRLSSRPRKDASETLEALKELSGAVSNRQRNGAVRSSITGAAASPPALPLQPADITGAAARRPRDAPLRELRLAVSDAHNTSAHALLPKQPHRRNNITALPTRREDKS